MNSENRNAIDARNLLILGYRDYIASRFLLLNDFLFQGASLSSTAVEKYLKSLLIGQGFKRKIHIEKWKEIKGCLSLKGINLFEELDPNFLKLLGKIYKLRYYDKIENQVFYGFIKWQFLGELDYLVHLIESRITLKYSSGNVWMSPYKSAMENKDEILYRENYILNGLDKKEYMEREGKCLIINIDKKKSEIKLEGPLKQVEYQGSILNLINFEKK